MRTFQSGWLCLTLAVCAWAMPLPAQQTAAPAGQNPPAPADSQQTPPSSPPPAQTPAAQTPPAQTPPPQTLPPQIPPDQTPPPPTGQTGVRPLPPPMPKVPDVRMPGETGIWVGFTGWFPLDTLYMDKGHDQTYTYYSRVYMQGQPKISQGFDIGLAVGLHNSIQVSYWEARAAGDTTPSVDTYLWGNLYPNGTLLSTSYRLQNFKISFNYLTWPYPVESRRFRLKTLWQVQYVGVRTAFDNPTLPLFDANGNPLLDSQGNPLSYATEGSKWYVTPTLGFGTEYWKSKRLRFETNTSGFAIPHHSTTIDGDASINYRLGHWEFKVGAKGFHFKTSPTSDFYMRGWLYSGLVGIRWYME